MSTAQTPYTYGITLGVVSQQVLPANPTRSALIFFNQSASATIAICPVNSIDATGAFVIMAAAIGGGGSIDIGPKDSIILDEFAIGSAWNAVADATNAVLTIWEFS